MSTKAKAKAPQAPSINVNWRATATLQGTSLVVEIPNFTAQSAKLHAQLAALTAPSPKAKTTGKSASRPKTMSAGASNP